MEPREESAGPYESAQVRLNAFFRYALKHEVIGQESAERLQALNDNIPRPFIDADVALTMQNRELPSYIPIIPTLRQLGDFAVGQAVRILQEPAANLHRCTLSGSYQNYLTTVNDADSPQLLLQLVAPSYVGLISEEEYQYYQFHRRGAGSPSGSNTGTQLSYIYANTEFARLLGEINLGPTFDAGLITTIRRHFRVMTHPYTPFKTHLEPLKEV